MRYTRYGKKWGGGGGGKANGTLSGETIEKKIRELRRQMNYDSETEDVKEREVIINRKGEKGKGKRYKPLPRCSERREINEYEAKP